MRDVYGKDITANQKLAVHGMNVSNASFERGVSVSVDPKKLVMSRDAESPYPYEANSTRFLCTRIMLRSSDTCATASPFNS